MVQEIKNVPFKSTNVRIKNLRKSALRLKVNALGRIAPYRARQIIARRFFAPSAYPTTSQEDRMLGQGKRFLLRVHNKSIHGWQWGKGPKILFVHGWNGRGIQFLPFFEPLTAAGYAVIAVDGPAHGESMGKTTNYFELTDMVRRIITPDSGFVIQGIVAHSIGAAAVVNALAHEDSAIDAVLIAPALRLKEILYNAFALHSIPPRLYLPIIKQLELQYGYRLDRDGPLPGIAKVRSRLLLVHDQNDQVTPFIDSRELVDRHAHLSLHATCGLGHSRLICDRTVIERAIRFLCGTDTGRGTFAAAEPVKAGAIAGPSGS